METQASHINAGAGGVSDQDRTASQRKHCGHPPPVCWTGSGKGLGVLLRAETACLQKPERHRTNCSAHNLPAECAGGHQWTGRLRTQGLPPVSLYCLLLSVLLSRVRLFATPWTAARLPHCQYPTIFWIQSQTFCYFPVSFEIKQVLRSS